MTARDATRDPNRLLYGALIADAIASCAMGALLIAGGDRLANVLGLPAALTRECALLLLPYGALVVLVATRPHISRVAARIAVALNAALALGCGLFLVAAPVTPTAAGYALVGALAIVAAALGETQFIALRRDARTGAAA